MTFDLYDVIGLAGITLTLQNYARLQLRREYVRELAYSAGNFLGTLLVVISIFHRWNLSAFFMSLSSNLISVYGIYRCLKYKMRPSEETGSTS